jgi:DNA modification methylase
MHGGSPLQVGYCSLAELRPNPHNPRLHSKKQIAQIAESVRSFGFNVPILVNAERQVIAGHGRIEAAKLIGIREVPIISLAHLTPEQTRAFLIADNRLTENATWDERLLAEQLKFLSEAEIDFSIEATGFEMGGIDVLIEGLEPEAAEGADVADQIPEQENAPPVSRLDDLWHLGKHRVFCGSAVEAESFAELMDGKKACAVFIDPPYNVPIDGNVGGKGKIHHREFAMASGEMTPAEFTDFLASAFSRLAEHSQKGSLHYICMDWRHIEELVTAGKQVYSEMKNLCVWAKDNAGMGSLYRSQHELVFVFKNGEAPHRNNVQLGQFGRNRTNVWNYPGVNSFGRAGTEGNLLALHPTVKPVSMVADAIMDCTMRGDIVIDSFAGGGTSVIAAERVGRICYAMELDPLYVDTIVHRWQQLTGGVAIHAKSGKSFNQLAAEVSNGEER